MKIRPIFKTIDIFSFIQFLSRQTNYIIKFFLLKVLYLVCQQGRREILVAALEGQMSGLLLDQFPRRAPVRALRINTQVLAAAFGENFSAGDPWPNEPLRWKGGLIHI